LWADYNAVYRRLMRLPLSSTVIHGGAKGADAFAGIAAEQLGYDIEVFKADWKQFGKRAGFVRNLTMLNTAPDLVIAFWDGDSLGTKHTIDEARKRGIEVEVYMAEETSPPGDDGDWVTAQARLFDPVGADDVL
jgi:hypothetical protein